MVAGPSVARGLSVLPAPPPLSTSPVAMPAPASVTARTATIASRRPDGRGVRRTGVGLADWGVPVGD